MLSLSLILSVRVETGITKFQHYIYTNRVTWLQYILQIKRTGEKEKVKETEKKIENVRQKKRGKRGNLRFLNISIKRKKK